MWTIRTLVGERCPAAAYTENLGNAQYPSCRSRKFMQIFVERGENMQARLPRFSHTHVLETFTVEDIPEDIWEIADKALTPSIFFPHMEIQSAIRNMRVAIAKAIRDDRDGRWRDIDTIPSHCEALVCVTYKYSDQDEWTTDMWVDVRIGHEWLICPMRPDLPAEPTHWM